MSTELVVRQAVLPPTPEGLSWKEKLAYIVVEMLKLPQIEAPVQHSFQNGNYVRTVMYPAGSIIISNVHVQGHSIRLLQGAVVQVTEHGTAIRVAGDQDHTPPGHQMCGHALTDIVIQTVHPNPDDEQDVRKLERLWFESKDSLIAFGEAVHASIAKREGVKEIAA